MVDAKLLQLVASIAPESAAKLRARRKVLAIAPDENNFSDPSEVATLLKAYDVISFDLFDTLVRRDLPLITIHRKTAEFADLTVTGDDGPLPDKLLLHARGFYQGIVKKRGSPERNEVRLEDVFDGALAPYVRSKSKRTPIVEALIAYELETESQTLRLDQRMRDLLVELKAQGKTTLLQTDTYFRAQSIEALLRSFGLYDLFDHVFASAEVGVTKHSGQLFKHVDETLDLVGSNRIHFGDNWNSDVLQARAAGWDALHYYNRDQEIRRESIEIVDRLAGSGGRRSISSFEHSVKQHACAGQAHPVLAAALSAFAGQVMSTALLGQYDRVLFLTRDGTLFQKLCEHIATTPGFAGRNDLPSLEELAISRRMGVVLNMPELKDPGIRPYLEQQVAWLTGAPLSLRTILSAFSIVLDELDLKEQDKLEVETGLGDATKDLSSNEFFASNPVRSAVYRVLQFRKDRLERYLQQQALFDQREKVLLVDVGYSGTIAKALSVYMARLEDEGQPVQARLDLMLFAQNRYYRGNLGQMHPRIALLTDPMINPKNSLDRAAGANFSWLEPFVVDRSRGDLLEHHEDEDTNRITPRFADGVSDARDHEDLLKDAGAIQDLIRQSSLSAESATSAIRKMLLDEVTRPGAQMMQVMRGARLQFGIGETKDKAVLTRIRPWRLMRDLQLAIRGDYWVQGSLTNSGLKFLCRPINRVLGSLTK